MKKIFLILMLLVFAISAEAQWDRIFVKDSIKLGNVWFNQNSITLNNVNNTYTGTQTFEYILPNGNRLFNLGSNSYYWLSLYVQNLYTDSVKTDIVFIRDVLTDSTLIVRKSIYSPTIDTLRLNISNTSDSVSSHNSRLNVVTDSLTSHNTRINTNVLNISKGVDSISNHNTRLNNNVDSITSHNTRINTNVTNISKNVDSISAHNGKLNVLTDSITSHNTRINTNVTNIGKGVDSIAAHNTRFNVLTDSITSHNTRINTNVLNISKGVDSIAAHNTRLNTLVDSISSHNSRINGLGNTSNLTDSISSHNTRLNVLTDSITSHNTRINTNVLNISKGVDSVAAHNTRLNTLVDSTSSHNTRINTNRQLTVDSISSHNTRILAKLTASDSTRIAYLDKDNTFTRDMVVDSSLNVRVYKVKSVVAIADSTINCNLSNQFSKTLGATQRFVFTNFDEGQTVNVAVTNTASNYVVTWVNPAGLTIKWSGGTQPVQTVGAKVDVWTFIRMGTNIYGSVVQNF